MSVIVLTFTWKVLRLQRGMGAVPQWTKWLVLASAAACAETLLLAAMQTSADAVVAGLIFSLVACVGAIVPAASAEVLAGVFGLSRLPGRVVIWLAVLTGAGLVATTGNAGVQTGAFQLFDSDYTRIRMLDGLFPLTLSCIGAVAGLLGILYWRRRHEPSFSAAALGAATGLVGALLLDVLSAHGHTALPLVSGFAGLAFVLTVALVVESRARDQILNLEQRTESAEANAKARSRFLANMSHELRTPLNGVQGMVQILLDDNRLSDEARQLVRSLGAAGRKLGHLIEEILDLERMAGDGSQLASEPFAPAELLTKVAQTARGLNTSDRVTITHRPLPEHQRDVVLLGDARRLSEALLNLVTNALKYTRSGQIELSCRMTEASGGAMRAVFALRDTGSGVTNLRAAIRPLGASSDDEASLHHPLSLGITLRLAEVMGGRFAVQSASGHGSTFSLTLRLPVAPEALEEPLDADRMATPEGLFGATIMVVDDHPVNRLVTTAPLERLGATVLCAATGEAALATMAETAVDLVLMDLHMPGVDGVESSARIRAAEQRGQLAHAGRVPIVAVTADSSPEAEAACRDGGLVGFLGKPFEAQALTSMVYHHLPENCSVSRPPTPALVAASEPVGAMSYMLKLVSGRRDLAEELIGEYIKATPTLIEALASQFEAGELDAARMAAHTIKGSSLSLGFDQVGAAARQIEIMLKTGAVDGLSNGIHVLRHAEKQIETSIQAYLEAGK
jgi:signal transduction histidine kinase/CheY-like chemotaxis protein